MRTDTVPPEADSVRACAHLVVPHLAAARVELVVDAQAPLRDGAAALALARGPPARVDLHGAETEPDTSESERSKRAMEAWPHADLPRVGGVVRGVDGVAELPPRRHEDIYGHTRYWRPGEEAAHLKRFDCCMNIES